MEGMNFDEIHKGIEKISQEYNFIRDQNFVLRIHYAKFADMYFFSVKLQNVAPLNMTLNFKFDIVDHYGKSGFALSKFITFEKKPSFKSITKLDVKYVRDFIEEDSLIIRCSLSPEVYLETFECSTQTDDLPFTGDQEIFVDQAIQTEDYSTSGDQEISVEQATQTEDSNSSTSLAANNLEKLSADLKAIYVGQADTDCILKATDGQLSAHRAILSARSKVFAAMFHHDSVERRTGEVDIEDVEATILRDLLYYIYTGKITGLTSNTAVRLYAAADKYNVLELREACLSLLYCSLTIENVCDAAILARTHAEDALEIKIVRFIANRFEEVMESRSWERFLETNPVIASKYLAAAFRHR